MNISIKAKSPAHTIEKILIKLDSNIDVIPFITMKYLSQKQEENKDKLMEFQDKYGFIFREYELISNIMKKYDKKDDSYILDMKSSLNALKNSQNNTIKEIFSRISEEKLTKDTAKGIIKILESKQEINELYNLVHYKQIDLKIREKNEVNIPPFYNFICKLATINHTPVNVYDPTSMDGQTVSNLEEFEHATLYEKDEEEYYHLIQNMIINDIALEKISVENKEVLVDETDNKYDTIISIPYSNRLSKLPDQTREKYKEYKTKRTNSIHLLNLIDHLDDDGIIITTTTQDLLVKQDGYNLRKCLIERNLLDTIIEYETGFRTRDITILIIKKNKETEDFLFFKPRQFLPGLILPDMLEKIYEGYENREAIPKLASIITKEEIIENNYNLNTKRYVYTLDYERKSIKEVINKQREYATEIRQLDDEIDEMLKNITKD